jgi:lysophospholipase L1-like esterase
MRSYILTCILIFSGILINAQDELKWNSQVKALMAIEHSFPDGEEIVVLSGSSSALMWKDIGDYYPNNNIINNGFGGSQMHELLFFVEELIIDYKPYKIFIYEGDNDISSGKSKEEIIESTKKVISEIRKSLPEAEIYFISPKPSLVRWNLKAQYLELNVAMKALCDNENLVDFIDVWDPMLDKDGEPIKEIFIEDGLHMNQKGYDIWAEQVRPFMEK